ncbi:MAG: hypothetical protein M0009_16425 [Deltaproteobacteria bacterium]|nr:hypothetical protein [Deltaproteobacteria bacterium]
MKIGDKHDNKGAVNCGSFLKLEGCVGAVVNYANNRYQRFCQIKLDNSERVLVSARIVLQPGITVVKLCCFGLLPSGTIWEYNPAMAGGYSAFIKKVTTMFQTPPGEEPKHPFDALVDRILPCRSISEVKALLESKRDLSEQEALQT